ncbi:MAG TPA: hypothetical protein PLD90_15760 [Rhodocyclaceae bacterium]|nr:hypothetical protein [Nitrospira sp.]HMY51099.1 hypothetical protein [Rhodocyclaceae bacterium]
MPKEGATSHAEKAPVFSLRDAFKTPNVEVTGAARLYRAASSD